MRLIALICLVFFASPSRAEVTVFAAASLRGALDAVNAEFEGDVRVSYASSATLARQIAQGAPADVFVSASTDWVQYLEDDEFVSVLQSADLMSNRLVLVASSKASETALEDLPYKLEGRNLAVGFVDAVPAGIYAQQAFENLSLWERVAPHIVQTDNVRAALALVELGEVGYGVVYQSDAQSTDARVLDVVPSELHSEIIYKTALLSEAPDAMSYMTHLTSVEAQLVFAEFGFIAKGADDG
ncbi:molybdate ABC transporter substrate-binding protein [Cognatishimia activa]|uniref:Molybdate-binding periplasmic protein n=1 Tax=Cognatishimia activa TaxID=1715691 RepID=A0A0N7MBK7_9RHOB|nr:molybdate ABC transporter substrate-binding protein [Cognatishimia activa]CUI89809.1 Molybdate-binding periplasmic protein precursor [Cognatishimia activa]CUK25680.1 Molybdate-binding periplasmic protein precursor [Cognatishimia activa]